MIIFVIACRCNWYLNWCLLIFVWVLALYLFLNEEFNYASKTLIRFFEWLFLNKSSLMLDLFSLYFSLNYLLNSLFYLLFYFPLLFYFDSIINSLLLSAFNSFDDKLWGYILIDLFLFIFSVFSQRNKLLLLFNVLFY